MNLIETKSVYLTTVKFEANTSFQIFSELSSKIHKNNLVNIDVILLIPQSNLIGQNSNFIRFECFYNTERFQKDFNVSDFLNLNDASNFFEDNELKIFYPNIDQLNKVKKIISNFDENDLKHLFNNYTSYIN